MSAGLRMRGSATASTSASMRRPFCASQVLSAIDQKNMGEGLREIAQLPMVPEIVFLRQQTDIIAQSEHLFENRPGFGMPAHQHQIIDQPEGARQKSSFARR